MTGEEVYSAFIDGELKTERERRATLEARGVSVVAQSGGLVTLLTGIGALAKGAGVGALPTVAFGAVIVALVFFLGAAVFGILVNIPHLYPPHPVADAATMTEMRTSKRDHTDAEARSVIAHLHIGTVDKLRKGNDLKVQWISAAQFAQVLAVVALSVAVWVIITHPSP
ncbi:hypothetical protein GCM10009682_15210 [Luedemannella flava]|uniref:Uncharacterized protein n=1 Tax=Luedemannella flava TaxID=349316 RepID=A0ABP4XZS2_9ACTN